VKILHTSDWHVGKTIRGHSRAVEHEAVLDEMVALVAAHQVDLVVIVGDLFDTASPTAESEHLVYRALLGFREAGAQVAMVAGNHDNPLRLGAVAPVLDALSVHVVPQVVRPSEGGVMQLALRSGEDVRLALLPFLSQRSIIKADDLMSGDVTGQLQKYADRYRKIVAALCEPLVGDMVNVVVAHTYVERALSGGGERVAHLGGDYAIASSVFPSHVHYVALGHLHRAQRIEGATQIHYCGSPLQLDFGEIEQRKQVNLIEAEVGRAAKVTALPLGAGRALRVVRGTLDDVREVAGELGDTWVRVELREPARAGLADEVRELVPTAVDVVTLGSQATGAAPSRATRRGKTPHELFAAYCAEREYEDERVQKLFADLLEESSASAAD
jgi:exonuclease SbcD